MKHKHIGTLNLSNKCLRAFKWPICAQMDSKMVAVSVMAAAPVTVTASPDLVHHHPSSLLLNNSLQDHKQCPTITYKQPGMNHVVRGRILIAMWPYNRRLWQV